MAQLQHSTKPAALVNDSRPFDGPIRSLKRTDNQLTVGTQTGLWTFNGKEWASIIEYEPTLAQAIFASCRVAEWKLFHMGMDINRCAVVCVICVWCLDFSSNDQKTFTKTRLRFSIIIWKHWIK